jgi:hypothetical protein
MDEIEVLLLGGPCDGTRLKVERGQNAVVMPYLVDPDAPVGARAYSQQLYNLHRTNGEGFLRYGVSLIGLP